MTGLDAGQVLDVFERRDLKDKIVNAKDLRVAEVDLREGYIVLDEQGYMGSQEHILGTDTSIGQFLNRITPRYGLFVRDYIDDPELQADIIQHRLEKFAKNPPRKGDAQLLFRAMRPHGTDKYITRAVLSDQYTAYNHETILGRVLDQHPDLKLTRAYAGWDDMFLTFSIPQAEQTEIRPGDIVSSGISIFNGETGGRSLGFEDFVERLVCANGARRRERENAARFRHVGNLLHQKVDRGMEAAINNIYRTPELMSRAADQQVRMPDKGGVKEVYRDLVKRARLPQSFVGSFEKAHAEDEYDAEDHSVLGFVNGITRTARDEKNIYRQVELEELAGDILEFPTKYVKLATLAPSTA